MRTTIIYYESDKITMNIKLLSAILLLGIATTLGACGGGAEAPAPADSPAATTSPSPSP
jgi:hypothetical protein